MAKEAVVKAGQEETPAARKARLAREAKARARRAKAREQAKKKKDCNKNLKEKDKKKLRKASPGPNERKEVNKASPKKCPICGGSDPPGFAASGGAIVHGALAADHIVPFDKIVKMKGFACLKSDPGPRPPGLTGREKQLKVLNNPRNISALCGPCNSSKRERGVNYMLGKGGRSGATYPQAGLDYLKQQQGSMSKIGSSLSGQIGRLL